MPHNIIIYLMSSLFAATYTWDLNTSHTNIVPALTDNVTLKCIHDKDINNNKGLLATPTPTPTLTSMKTMLRIRILKLDADAEKWKVFASLTLPSTTTVVEQDPLGNPGVVTSGRLGATNESFLSITWPSASGGTSGKYKCQVEGFVGENSHHVQLETREVQIIKSDVTPEALMGILGKLKESVEEIADRVDILSENQKQEPVPFDMRYWPVGPFALLATSSGCPDTRQSNMSNGWLTNWQYSQSVPKHNTSEVIHLKSHLWGYRRTYYFLNMSFCLQNNQTYEQSISWPRGKYCLNAAPACPVGFMLGVLSFNLANNVGSTLNSTPFVAEAVGQTSYNFCCRDDGDADVPIVLPNDRPFYLYRFGGKCQSVMNTDVTNEWIEIDTDDNEWDRYSNRFHPDGKINDVRMELCYYHKGSE